MLSMLTVLMQEHPWLFYGFIGIVGLCVGSFLNVVINRLPIMLKQRWQQECVEFLQLKEQPIVHQKINLAYPPSHCPLCKHSLSWWQNIPLLSHFILRGKCHFCHQRISSRYWIVEVITAVVTILAISHWQISVQSLAATLFLWMGIVLSFIDLEHHLLPDQLTLSLLWFGLLVNIENTFTTLPSAVWGAMISYLIFAIIGWAFHKLRGIEGLGQGDYKLLACCGAWLGVEMLLPIILISSLLGLMVAFILLITKKISRETPVAFGPFVLLAASITLFFHQQLLNLFL